MRDILDIIDNTPTLGEGVGLANRKPGEKFKNDVGDIVTFQSLDFYPDSGRYNSAEELDDAVQQMLADKQLTADQIHWTNQPTKGAGAFQIATFTGENGQPYYLGRWTGAINSNRANNKFAHSDIPGGFKYQSKSGQKENSGYKPSEWITQLQNNTPETILQQCIAKFGEGSDLANALQIFIQSDIPCRVPRGDINPEAFRDYFAEVLQPIALVMGKKVQGNAADAADIFFGGGGYTDCTISFNRNTIGGLYDSLLVNPDGRQIKLSSKGKDGASASVVNLLTSVRELENTPNGKKLLKKHADVVDILNVIQKNGHFDAPLALGVKYGVINEKEAAMVRQMRSLDLGPNDQASIKKLLSDPKKSSKRLLDLYTRRNSKDPKRVIPIEHMTASIAYNVADYVNKNTDFSKAASEILNNAALVQMYTDTSATDDIITITKLTAVYPSETITGVLLDASKVYYSTGGKGNYTFTILKNGAKESDVSPMDDVDDLETAPAADDLPDFAPSRSKIKAAKSQEPLGTEKSLGRKRR
jgi:hypothetical protein